MRNTEQTGKVEVICGCMFAGKTEELIRRLRRAEIAEQSITVFSPEVDDRYNRETIGSHNGKNWNANVICADESGVEKVKKATDEDVVAIDEFNFFTEEFIDAINYLANNNVRVIVSGLDQTFRAEPFNPLPNSLAIADTVDKLTAICEVCGGEATKTQRLVNGDPADESSPTVLVGGDDSYEARCRECFVAPHTITRSK